MKTYMVTTENRYSGHRSEVPCMAASEDDAILRIKRSRGGETWAPISARIAEPQCGNRWKFGRDTCARTPGHVGPHRTTERQESWSFGWFDSEGAPAE